MESLNSYLTFQIGGESFATSVSYVQHILEYEKLTKVPQTPEYLLGVLNLRGEVLPVIDSRIKFGIQDLEITTNTCIIVMELEIDKEKVRIGTLVDSVSEVLEIDEEDIKAPPSIGAKVQSEFITGVYAHNERFIMLIDMNRVVGTNEIIELANVSREMNK